MQDIEVINNDKRLAVQVKSLIPTTAAPSLWDSAFALLQEPFALPPNVPPQKQEWIRLISYQWHIAMHCLFREEFSSKHKVPAKKVFRDAIAPQVEFLRKLLPLCERVHSLKGGETPYRTAGDWFGLIVLELRTDALTDVFKDQLSPVLLPPPESRKQKAWQPGDPDGTYSERGKTKAAGRKEAAIQELLTTRDALKSSLAEKENRFDPDLQPHLFALIRTAIEISDNDNDVFERNFWKPLCLAYSAWVREIDRGPDYKVLIEDGGKLKYKGEGSHMKTLYPRLQKTNS